VGKRFVIVEFADDRCSWRPGTRASVIARPAGSTASSSPAARSRLELGGFHRVELRDGSEVKLIMGIPGPADIGTTRSEAGADSGAPATGSRSGSYRRTSIVATIDSLGSRSICDVAGTPAAPCRAHAFCSDAEHVHVRPWSHTPPGLPSVLLVDITSSSVPACARCSSDRRVLPWSTKPARDEAWMRVRTVRPDVVLMDLAMPGKEAGATRRIVAWVWGGSSSSRAAQEEQLLTCSKPARAASSTSRSVEDLNAGHSNSHARPPLPGADAPGRGAATYLRRTAGRDAPKKRRGTAKGGGEARTPSATVACRRSADEDWLLRQRLLVHVALSA